MGREKRLDDVPPGGIEGGRAGGGLSTPFPRPSDEAGQENSRKSKRGNRLRISAAAHRDQSSLLKTPGKGISYSGP
jgi:hypothetical protein